MVSTQQAASLQAQLANQRAQRQAQLRQSQFTTLPHVLHSPHALAQTTTVNPLSLAQASRALDPLTLAQNRTAVSRKDLQKQIPQLTPVQLPMFGQSYQTFMQPQLSQSYSQFPALQQQMQLMQGFDPRQSQMQYLQIT